MLFKQTCHPHFSPVANCRVPGPRASPFSLSCLEDRQFQPAPDRQIANFVVEPRSSEGIGPERLGRSPSRPVACGLRTGGSGFVTDSSLQDNFHVVTHHHFAVLLNKDTFKYDISCTTIQVSCSLRYATWAVEGLAVTGKFHRAPDQSGSYFTIANIQINNECAERRSVCIALLLLVLKQTCETCTGLGSNSSSHFRS